MLFCQLISSQEMNGCIGDYCQIKSGYAFKSKWWQKHGISVVKIGSIEQDCLNINECAYVSEDKICLAKDFVVFGGDLLIAMTGATLGKFALVPKVNKPILVNQRVGKFFLGSAPLERVPFIFCTLKQPDVIREIVNRGQGSAQPNISATDIMSVPCIMPNTKEIDFFNSVTAPLFEKIVSNQYENTKLANLRDTLLPRLMSGELDVSELDI